MRLLFLTTLLACTMWAADGFVSHAPLALRGAAAPGAAGLGSAGRGSASRHSRGGFIELAMSAQDEGARNLSRRGAISGLLGASIVVGNAAGANAEVVGSPPSIFSQLQGGVQGIVAPGNWLGQFIGINSHSESWEFDASPDQVSKAMVDAIRDITPK